MRFRKEVPDVPNNLPLCTSSERVHFRDETVHNEVLQCALAQRLVTNITVYQGSRSSRGQHHVAIVAWRTRVRELVPTPQDLYPAGTQEGAPKNPHGIEMILEKGESENRETQDDLVRM